jgi:hypothetical protein
MGICHSCLVNGSPTAEDDDVLSDSLFLPQNEVDIIIPRTPTIIPQTPKERGLSKIVQQRPRRASLAVQTHLLETTPLLHAPPSPRRARTVTFDPTATEDVPRGEDDDDTQSTEPLSPSETFFDPFPQLDVGGFYQYAKEMSSRQAKNMFWLRSYWEVVCASLRPRPWLEQFDNEHVTLRSLVMISESGAPEDLLHYLAVLVEGKKLLKQVADEYLLKPLYTYTHTPHESPHFASFLWY